MNVFGLCDMMLKYRIHANIFITDGWVWDMFGKDDKKVIFPQNYVKWDYNVKIWDDSVGLYYLEDVILFCFHMVNVRIEFPQTQKEVEV